MNTIKKFDFNPVSKDYQSGEVIVCQIQERVQGGFLITLPHKDIRTAFLPTCLKLDIGLTMEVFYVGIEFGRLIFSITEEEFRKRIPHNTNLYTLNN